MARIDLFEMERMQSLYWYKVEYDLSESGVRPLDVRELLEIAGEDRDVFLRTRLGYPLSEGAVETREHIAAWYPGATTADVTVVNGGSEANFLALWTLLESGDRLAFMVPNYMQGMGLGRHFGEATDPFSLRIVEEGGRRRWALDLDELDRAVGPRTKVVMVCTPNNPTGHVLSEREMAAIVDAARRVGAWLVSDEIYRGAEVDGDEVSPTFFGRYERVVVTSGLSKAFGMPGLRVGWAVAPEELISEIWVRHDYTTLTPSMISDVLCRVAMRPGIRDRILDRTRAIVREHLPRLEEWIDQHPELRYTRPTAGAIAYLEHDLPIDSVELVDRIREEQSVLLVPGRMFGFPEGRDAGFRIGFGYDIEATLKGLDRAASVLRSLDDRARGRPSPHPPD